MIFKTLFILLIGFAILSCESIYSEQSDYTQKTLSSEPNYHNAIQFINDYIDFCNDINSLKQMTEWIEKRNDVTDSFKIELKRILHEGRLRNPELGLGFDPILDAQDSPNRFEIDKTNGEYLTVKGAEWPDFILNMKIKCKENSWLIDGSGIINIPENKRPKK